MKTIPTSQNEGYGFYGTMRGDARSAWPLAMTAISDATGENPESVRAFLDSRHGRHFADEVQGAIYSGQDLHDAIEAATRKWMGWTINAATTRQTGIPKGLPYLTGYVIHCGILAEATN